MGKETKKEKEKQTGEDDGKRKDEVNKKDNIETEDKTGVNENEKKKDEQTTQTTNDKEEKEKGNKDEISKNKKMNKDDTSQKEEAKKSISETKSQDIIDGKEDGTANVQDIFSKLTSLFQITQSGNLIKPSYESIDILSYGPRELKCNFIPGVPAIWMVENYGDDCIPFLRKYFFYPKNAKSWSKIDEFLDFRMKTFDSCIELSKNIILEPEKEISSNGLRYHPHQVGIPRELFKQIQFNFNEQFQIKLDLFLTPINHNSLSGLEYYKKIRIAWDTKYCHLLNLYFELLRDTKATLINDFRTQLLITTDSENSFFNPLTIDKRIMYYPTAAPNRLCEVFAHLPRGLELSYMLVCRTITPMIKLVPINAVALSTNIGTSTNRLSLVNQLSNYTFKSSMDEPMYAYFSFFFSPGAVQLELNLTRLDKGDELNLMIALMAKLIFCYSDKPRWCNITQRSVDEIDSIILKYLDSKGLIIRNDMNHGNTWTDYVPVQRKYKGEYWNILATDERGKGWAMSGNEFYNYGDTSIYSGCAIRQSYITTFDKPITSENESEVPGNNESLIFRAIIEVCSALQKTTQVYRELTSFFQMNYTNIIRFMCTVNNYNRCNWYSGLRITESMAQNEETYDEITRIVSIDHEAIVILFRSMRQESVAERRVDFVKQFQIESSLMFDYITFSVKKEYLKKILAIELNIKSEYTNKEIENFCLPDEGPIKSHIEYLQNYKLSKEISTDLSWLRETERVADYFIQISEIAYSLNLDCGYMEKTILMDRLNDLNESLSLYKQCAVENRPYQHDLVIIPEKMLTLVELRDLMKTGKALTTLMLNSSRGIELSYPIPFRITSSYFSGVVKCPISVLYGERRKTVRNAIRNQEIELIIVNPSRVIMDALPDMYIKTLQKRQTFGFNDNIYNRFIIDASTWCDSILSTTGVINCVQLENFELRSIFNFNNTQQIIKKEDFIVHSNNMTLFDLIISLFALNFQIPLEPTDGNVLHVTEGVEPIW